VALSGQDGNPFVRSERAPDLLITTLKAARLVWGKATASWTALALDEVFRSKPDKTFPWYGVLSAVELKRLCDIEIDISVFTTPVETRVFENPMMPPGGSKKCSTRSEYELSAAQAEPSAKRVKYEGL